MEYKLCGHDKTYKHGTMPNGHQRYHCLECKQTFSESFDTIYYYRHVCPEQIRQVLQAHSEGNSLRGVAHVTGLAYNTVASLVRSASAKAQLIHNQEVAQIQTDKVGDEMWSFVKKKQKRCLPDELMVGDCWTTLRLAKKSGLILAAKVGKHTDKILKKLIVTTEGKTDCKKWNTDDWGRYKRKGFTA